MIQIFVHLLATHRTNKSIQIKANFYLLKITTDLGYPMY